MLPIEVAIFDVDGVLLDSLEAHLQVCRDEARRMDLHISVPDASMFRARVARGAVISPMEEFFHTFGFGRSQAKQADDFYRREFAQRYPVYPFKGITEMLTSLKSSGLVLGIVTSNTLKNISAALGADMDLFDQRCVFADDDAHRLSKTQALLQCAKQCRVSTSAVIYVGDQPRDYFAAQEAHTHFLGVTYGWGIEEDDKRFPLAHSPAEIAPFICARAGTKRAV
jgi:phosphoglycolate phosphatase-like HAD superfamily hydrolase